MARRAEASTRHRASFAAKLLRAPYARIIICVLEIIAIFVAAAMPNMAWAEPAARQQRKQRRRQRDACRCGGARIAAADGV